MAVTIKNSSLEEYLDATRSQHAGYGYSDFDKFLTSTPPVSKRAIATIFDVAWQTVYNWIKVYEKERGSREHQGN